MDPDEWDAIWWYYDMRYPCSSCVDGLSTEPPSFGTSQIRSAYTLKLVNETLGS